MSELALPMWAGYRAGPNDTPFHGDAEVTFHGKHLTAGQLAALDTAREAPDGTMHRYQTVDPGSRGGMSPREDKNAARLFQQTQPGDTLTLVPKPVPSAKQVNYPHDVQS